jgi:hypothetical protein
MINQNQLNSVGYFSYLGSMITNVAKFTLEIKCRMVMAKAAFNNKKSLFTTKLKLNLKKKLVNSHIWITDLNGAETWSLRTIDQKYPGSFEM